MIRNNQVHTNPTLWPIFLPSKYSPIFSPSSLPNLSHYPRFVHPFFLTPCPALPTHCMLVTWMIIWLNYLWRNGRPIAIGIRTNLNYDVQVSQNLFMLVHYGDQESILEEPSPSLHDVLVVFDFLWASDGMKETQRSLPDHSWTQCTNQILFLPLSLPRQPAEKLL